MTATTGSVSASHLRYLPEEISLPRNVAVEDLEWMTFAWTLQMPTTERGASYAQIVLGPGMLIEAHSQPFNLINPFFPGCEEGVRHSVEFRERKQQSPLDWASYRTEVMKEGGYKINSDLLVCDFSVSPLYDQFAFKERTREGRFMETLGDIVDTRPDETKSVLAHIASVRLKKALGM